LRSFRITLLVSCLVLATSATNADAVTTIGSDLTLAPTLGLICGGGCTVSSRSIPGRQVSAPTDGVIVRWRVRVDVAGASNLKLRVVRGTGPSTGAGTSQPESTPAAAGIYTFETRLPIRAGDFIGVDCCASSMNLFNDTGTATRDSWQPPLTDGASPAAGSVHQTAREVLLNADIEPDVDSDGYGDETQDACPADAAAHQAPCPDRIAPETTITQAPKKVKTHKKKAKVSVYFVPSEPASTFSCKLDSKSARPCVSPFVAKVGKGKHHFSVFATDAAGNVEVTPATASFRVKRKHKH
jgi:hypothetical protein